MSEESNVSAEMASEIESAVDTMVSAETARSEGTDVTEEAKAESIAASPESVSAEEETTQAEEVVTDESTETGEGEAEGTEGANKETEAVVDDAPQISDEMLERALNVDISVSDARSISPDVLDRIVSRREVEAEIIAQTDKPEADRPEEIIDPFEGMTKLDPELHDPTVIKAFTELRDLAKAQRDRLQGFESKQEQAESAMRDAEDARQQAETREVTRFFDKQVIGLGEDFHGVLGVGDYDSLDKGGAQFANRNKIAEQMAVQLSGYKQMGLNPPAQEEVFTTAARLVLGDTYQEIHDKKLSGSLEKQSTQHIQRPGGSKAKSTLTPEEEAAAAVDAKFFSN